MYDDYPKAAISGVVLAGGRARRMDGRDKGLLPLAGRPMAAHAVERLRPQVGEVLINANRNLAAYQSLGCRVISDGIGEYFGPLAGMLAALDAIATPYLLTVPCDSPLLAADCARRLLAALERDRAELAVARGDGRLQPVFALLRRELRDSLRGFLEAGGRKIDRWFEGLSMTTADFADHPEMFRNVNTPDELAQMEAWLDADAGPARRP
ncbi:MAG: molybdenum cofactor guanylyltransferase [Pseudomonadota bacterium]|nr:molybdenum cofactor guanylyltransferase [Pseudomonadota bacterium]